MFPQALVKRTPGSNLESSMSNTSMACPFSSLSSSTEDKARNASVSALRRHQNTTPMLSPTERPQGGVVLGEGVGGMQLMMMEGEELAKFHRMLGKQLMQSQDIILSLLVRKV